MAKIERNKFNYKKIMIYFVFLNEYLVVFLQSILHYVQYYFNFRLFIDWSSFTKSKTFCRSIHSKC